jgi:hypothetical protein
MKSSRSLRVALVVVGVALLSPVGVVSAHPFGDPQQAEVSATADGLRIDWSASTDDLGVLASWIGATDGSGSIMVYEDGEFAPDESSELPGTQLARAPQLADYFLERIDVTAGDVTCTGDLLPVEDVEAEGVTVDFDCGGPVAAADVRIATLTDVDENYRTLATGPRGQRHAYTADHESFGWSLPAHGSAAAPATAAAPVTPGRSAALQLGGVGVGAAVLAGLGFAVRRRLRTS